MHVWWKLKTAPNGSLFVSPAWGIHCENKRTVADHLSAMNWFLRTLAIMDVELKPEWTARLSGNLLKTTSCRGADHHQSIRSPRSLCSRTLSFRMYKAMK